eukprot:TRINITY_DN26835_c0_g1_i1.p1 TRINITY_DN26835_c0_g1~~TRINITY_DN26835_c0_g1_i1.p1  ORF type:complete len:402 (+),score=68.62 TRINITY_DN26835_c0_g1_i1:106-1311(+)
MGARRVGAATRLAEDHSAVAAAAPWDRCAGALDVLGAHRRSGRHRHLAAFLGSGGAPLVPTGFAFKPPNPIDYTTGDGKLTTLAGTNEKACVQSCSENPDLASRDPQAINKCKVFCGEEFASNCFPGDASVTVLKRGPTALSDLRVGDVVLSLRRPVTAGGAQDVDSQWSVAFEPVLAWLHREPDASGEAVEIRHSLGQVRLTPDHLLFVRRRQSSSVHFSFAAEVRAGDHVVAVWLDGGVATPEVLSVRRVRIRGLYAPLLRSGVMVVDSTAVSCYAMPDQLGLSPAVRRIIEVLGRALTAQDSSDCCDYAPAAAAVAHAVAGPVRVAAEARAALAAVASAVLPTTAPMALVAGDNGNGDGSVEAQRVGINPYLHVLYSMVSAVLAPQRAVAARAANEQS